MAAPDSGAAVFYGDVNFYAVTRQMQQRPATEQVETPTQTSAPVTEAQD